MQQSTNTPIQIPAESQITPADPAPASAGRQFDPFVGTCPPWCWSEAGDATLHPAEDQAADRVHYSRFYADHLPIELEEGFRDQAGVVHPATLEVYLQQHYRAAEPDVMIDRSGSSALRLTLIEAGQLAEALQAAIAAAAA